MISKSALAKPMIAKPMIANIIAFQLGWLACVLGAAYGLPWAGVIIAALVITVHIVVSKNRPLETRLILCAMAIGLIFDAIPVHLQWIQFAPMPFWSNALAPAWMLALWALLAITLNASLAWLKGRWLLAFIFGAVGGPLAYLGGERLGAMHIIAIPQSIIYLAFGWGLAMPVLFKLASCNNKR